MPYHFVPTTSSLVHMLLVCVVMRRMCESIHIHIECFSNKQTNKRKRRKKNWLPINIRHINCNSNLNSDKYSEQWLKKSWIHLFKLDEMVLQMLQYQSLQCEQKKIYAIFLLTTNRCRKCSIFLNISYFNYALTLIKHFLLVLTSNFKPFYRYFASFQTFM